MSDPIGRAGSSQNVSNIQQPQDTPKTEAPKAEEAAAGASAASSEPDRGKVAEHQFTGKFMGVTLQAQAERELAPIGKNQKVDINDPTYRTALLRNSPQVNDISKKAGNDGDICGGAATTNALILSGKSPEQRKDNANSVRNLAKSYDPPVQIKPEEEAALKGLETGHMSPNDVANMQQLMDRVGHRMPLAGSNPSGMGLSTTQVACMMTKLSAHGAFKGSDVKMNCNTLQTGQPNPPDHWTVTVDGTFANSAAGAPKFDKALVYGGGTPSELQKGGGSWQNEIILSNSEHPPKVYAQFKQPNDPTNYHEAVFNTGQHKDPTSVGAFEDEIRRAAREQGQPIH
jgi:hypothetical protein